MEKMTSGQKHAYDNILSGRDVFVTGGAGTGKSYLLRHAIDNLRSVGKKVLVCAPTGTAAINVGGATIHSTFGYGKGPCITEKRPKLVLRAPKTVRCADVVIIDEVSMCRMDLMDSVIASIDKAAEKSGHCIQIVLVGDFYQLPPILPQDSNDRVIIEAFYGRPVGPAYAFQADRWRGRFVSVVLNEIIRQKDSEFAENLNYLRVGNPKCLSYFNSHSAANPITDAISIYATNESVDRANRAALDNIEGEECVFHPIIQGITDGIVPEDYGIPSSIHLKRFAEILLTSNDSRGRYAEVERFGESGVRSNAPLYHNGSRGMVIDIYDDADDPMHDALLIAIRGGQKIWLKRQRYDLYKYTVTDNNEIKKQIFCSIWQFPVKLAYAVTVHRGQGQTFEKANIDPSCKNYGQTYVAISRVRDIHNLYLYNTLRASDLRLNPIVYEFYTHLNEKNYIPSWDARYQTKDGTELRDSEQSKTLISTIVEENYSEHIECSKSERLYVNDQSDSSYILTKKNGRPPRYPSGSKVLRIPNELADIIEHTLDVVYPKSGMNTNKLQRVIEALEIIVNAE